MSWTEKQKNGSFRGRYRDANGKRCSAGIFTQEKQARRAADRRESEQREPGALNLNGGKMSWGAWFDKWFDSHVAAHATRSNYESTARLHIRPYWGDTRLHEIDATGVSRWVRTLQSNNVSPYSIRNAVTLFNTTLNAAVEDNYLGRNPARKVRRPDLPQATERYLTRNEVNAITFHMDGLNALIVWTAVQTGLRFGELAGLHWTRVDLERGTIQVVEKYDQKANVIDPVPKDKEQRTVPLPADLVDMLRHHRERQPPQSQATCGLTHRAGRCTSDLVFRGRRGAALKSNEWGRGPWRMALDLAGITDRVRPHDMRHTYASWLIQSGVPMAEIARVMGHADMEVLRRYAHLSNEGYEKVRSALDEHGRTGDMPDPIDEVASKIMFAPQISNGADCGANGRYTGLHLVTNDDAS